MSLQALAPLPLPLRLSPGSRRSLVSPGEFMHVTILTLYGLLAWVCALAWASIAGPDGAVLVVLLATPFIVSGVIVALLLAWGLALFVRWMWRNRSTFRLWRVVAGPGA